VELLRESPSPVLYYCLPLAQSYPPLARELFHPAFLACWSEIASELQSDLVRNLETVRIRCGIPFFLLLLLLLLLLSMSSLMVSLLLLCRRWRRARCRRMCCSR
jgi:serine/threonine-protein kinase mTOR